jgi:hypothetical protein
MPSDYLHQLHNRFSTSRPKRRLAARENDNLSFLLKATHLNALMPRADLYNGQASAEFGTTFEKSGATHWRRRSKPEKCTNSYEDYKHRILMELLEGIRFEA